MTRSTVFTSNRSQAVRLPKAVAFPADVRQVEIFSKLDWWRRDPDEVIRVIAERYRSVV